MLLGYVTGYVTDNRAGANKNKTSPARQRFRREIRLLPRSTVYYLVVQALVCMSCVFLAIPEPAISGSWCTKLILSSVSIVHELTCHACSADGRVHACCQSMKLASHGLVLRGSTDARARIYSPLQRPPSWSRDGPCCPTRGQAVARPLATPQAPSSPFRRRSGPLPEDWANLCRFTAPLSAMLTPQGLPWLQQARP